jgi:hypothetical protein
MTGFHVCDDYGEQQLIAHDAVLWCDKRGSRWRAADFEAPPPKSRLLAADPNSIDHTHRHMLAVWENQKGPTVVALDVWWAKAGAP